MESQFQAQKPSTLLTRINRIIARHKVRQLLQRIHALCPASGLAESPSTGSSRVGSRCPCDQSSPSAISQACQGSRANHLHLRQPSPLSSSTQRSRIANTPSTWLAKASLLWERRVSSSTDTKLTSAEATAALVGGSGKRVRHGNGVGDSDVNANVNVNVNDALRRTSIDASIWTPGTSQSLYATIWNSWATHDSPPFVVFPCLWVLSTCTS